MTNFFTVLSPQVAFAAGMLAQGLYKLVPLLDATGFKKLGGALVGALALTLGGVMKSKTQVTFAQAFLMFVLIFSGFCFFAFRKIILPKINELVLLCWNLGVWYILLSRLGIFNPLTLVLLVPTVFSFSVVFLNVQLNRFFQIFLYMWFIAMSVIVTATYFPWSLIVKNIQTHQQFSSAEAFFIGMALYYCFIYMLCVLSFIPFPTKHSKPGDELKRIKEHGDDVAEQYDEVQYHPAVSLLVLAIIISALGVNFVSHFTSEVVLLGILFGVSPIVGEKVHSLLIKIK